MRKVSISGLYDGEHIHLLEEPPTNSAYRVLVAFIEPADVLSPDDTVFLSSFGAWQDERAVEETLNDIMTARLSRTEPPAL